MSSRQEQKAAARAAREQAHQQATEAQRRRRIFQLVGAVAVAAIIVAIVVIASSGGGGGSDTKTTASGAAAGGAKAYQLLGGIPEKGFALGKPDAPVTLVEFNDMQCPVCKEYQTGVFPTLVQKYVRAGKVRMEMRLQSFIGPDSVKAGKAVAAAAAQNKAWIYSDIFYNDQGQENTGYVTDGFLRSLGKATPGLNVDQLFKDIDSPAATAALKQGDAEFTARGFSGTPSFLIGKTGGPLTALRFTALTPDQFTGPIDRLLGQ